MVAGWVVSAIVLAPAQGGASEYLGGAVQLYDARSAAALSQFAFHAPVAVFPFQVTGGFLASTSLAKSSPQGFGTAGLMPVPLLTSLGLVIPKEVAGVPVPEDVRKAFQSVDYTKMPNGCQSTFPAAVEGGSEASCGGPYQRDPALGTSGGAANGLTRAEGDLEVPLKTRTVSVSRASDWFVPALQAQVGQAVAKSDAGMREVGDRPEAVGTVDISKLTLFGALVVLEGIHSQARAVSDGTEAGTETVSDLKVAKASIGGVPALIGPDGVSVNRQEVLKGAPENREKLAALENQMREALAKAGDVTIRVAPAPEVKRPRPGQVSVESPSLVVEYDTQQPAELHVTNRIAVTSASLTAIPEEEEASTPAGGAGSADLGIGESQSATKDAADSTASGKVDDGEVRESRAADQVSPDSGLSLSAGEDRDLSGPQQLSTGGGEGNAAVGPVESSAASDSFSPPGQPSNSVDHETLSPHDTRAQASPILSAQRLSPLPRRGLRTTYLAIAALPVAVLGIVKLRRLNYGGAQE